MGRDQNLDCDEDIYLLLPGDPEFEWILGTTLPYNWRQDAWKSMGDYCFVVEPGSGLMRTASLKETREYLEGGEYDERLEEINEPVGSDY